MSHGLPRNSFSTSLILTISLVITSWLIPCAAGDLTPQQERQLFDEAQLAYDRGVNLLGSDPVQARQAFADAAARFQLLVQTGSPSGPLLYNLGNAYVQSGDVGQAIVNYRRAEMLIPGDARVQNNLHYARSLCSTQIEPSGSDSLIRSMLNWHYRTPFSWRFTAFALINAAMCLFLVMALMRPSAPLRWISAILILGWVVLGLSVAADFAGRQGPTEGVVVANDVIARKGNGSGYQPQFEEPLHGGVEFQLVEQRGDWLNIRLRNGEEGWIPSQAAALID